MMENYDEEYWKQKSCPKYDCRKESCKCGLKRVFLASALGDDSKDSPVAPKNGAYCNALVIYEANDHVYIYSTEGVPTLINVEGGDWQDAIEEVEKRLTKETSDREAADNVLQGEIDDIKNSPDVVDIVATYAALQAYDTSKLGDNDIVRVLQDETHDGQSTYYRWNKQSSTWTYIGAVGDYYTKGQVDTLLGDKQDKLTAGANITIDANNEISATDTTYSDFTGATIQQAGTSGLVPAPTTSDPDKYLKGDGSWGTPTGTTYTAGTNVSISSGNVISATDTTYSNFTGTDGNTDGTAGLVPAPLTTDSGKFLKADGTWDTAGGGGPTVVQTPGTSQTDVMSQNAVSTRIYPRIGTVNDAIGIVGAYDTQDSAAGFGSVGMGSAHRARADQSIAIGFGASVYAAGAYSTAIGNSAKTEGHSRAVAIGNAANAANDNSVAIGTNSVTTRGGEVNVGAGTSGRGYNSTDYRVIGGVHDGQDAHDAATVGQLNGRVLQNAGAPTTSTVGTVGQLLEDTTNGKLYQCTAVDTTDPNNPSYTWSEVGAGGGGGPTVVQTTGTSTTDVMSQNATTGLVFADPASRFRIQIGSFASNSNTGGVAIGSSASVSASNGIAIGNGRASADSAISIGNHGGNNVGADYKGSIALGAYSKPLAVGEMNIGSTNTAYGYNSTNYRLLSGVYDGQGLHDAATVAQGNTLSTSAPTTSTVGVLGQLYTDTTNMHTYQCTAISGDTYTWTQRW